MTGMDHDHMSYGPGGMASGMLMENGKYPDERFIDAMVPHHQSAIEMARVALKETENPAIEELAENIVSARKREIREIKQWRREWYPQS